MSWIDPAGKPREFPSTSGAEGVAGRFGVPTLSNAVVKATAIQQMKNVPLHKRAPLLSSAIQAGSDSVQGRRVCSSMTCGRLVVRSDASLKQLATMIEKRFQILVGDANGADKAVQRHLADKASEGRLWTRSIFVECGSA